MCCNGNLMFWKQTSGKAFYQSMRGPAVGKSVSPVARVPLKGSHKPFLKLCRIPQGQCPWVPNRLSFMSGYQLTRVYGQAGGELQVCVIQDRKGDHPPSQTPGLGEINQFWTSISSNQASGEKTSLQLHLARLDTITSSRPIEWFRLNLEEK